jgi:hypothetical protein
MIAPRFWVRAGLVALTLLHITLAIWILLAPRSFFDLKFVNMNMPYNEHLLLDFGAMNLAPALMLGVAARTMDRRLLRTALQSALLFWTVHFFIHLRYLHAMSAANDALLMTALAATVALHLGMLAVAPRAAKQPEVIAAPPAKGETGGA